MKILNKGGVPFEESEGESFLYQQEKQDLQHNVMSLEGSASHEHRLLCLVVQVPP